jgi:subtilisin
MKGFCVATVVSVVAAVMLAVPGAGANATVSRQYIVVLKPGADRAAAETSARGLGGNVFEEYKHALNGFAVRLPDAAAPALRSNPAVSFISLDGEFTAAAQSTQTLPAGIDRIDGDRSSTRSGDGRNAVGVNVAVLDTGVDPSHPDLNVAGGVNCSNGKSFADGNGHGTHVAGTIAAIDNGFGVVGVAPGARIWAIRVLNDKGSGNLSGLLCGIEFVISTRKNSSASDDIAVANMSLTGPGDDDGNCGLTKKDALHQAICNLADAGVVAVAAAGNGSNDLYDNLPATYDEVLAVTAMADYDGRPGGFGSQFCLNEFFEAPDDQAAFFSNFATLQADQAHTVAAPGVCVLSTVPGGYDLFAGTSQAAPHVAGVAALCVAQGACAGSGRQIMQKILGDAAAYNTANPGYGFQGDPLRPISGKYYGYLIRAGLY